MSSPPSHPSPRRELSLFDAACLVVGIIIGSGLYETSPLIAANVGGAGALVFVWVLGGVVSLIGALCYAELVSAFPREGGDYAFLTEAFGRRVGFLFAWAQFWIVRPGSTGAMAFVFAAYAVQLLPLPDEVPAPRAVYAVGSLAVLAAVNIAGVREGKWTQNLLTTAKVGGLLAIFAAAMFADSSSPIDAGTTAASAAAENPPPASFALAMILVFFTYGGWNDVAFVGAELKEPQRNVLRSLMAGVGCVTLVYVLANVAFLVVLGFDGVRGSKAVASDTVEAMFGDAGGKAVAVLICISALGAINGMVLTGARVYSAFGKDHRLFAPLGKWNARRKTPARALAAEFAATAGLIVLFGLPQWSGGAGGGFRRMVIFTVPAFWFFIFVSGLALFRLRRTRPGLSRPFRVPLYPLTPLLFCASSILLIYASIDYAWSNKSAEAFWAIGIFAVGMICTLFVKREGE